MGRFSLPPEHGSDDIGIIKTITALQILQADRLKAQSGSVELILSYELIIFNFVHKCGGAETEFIQSVSCVNAVNKLGIQIRKNFSNLPGCTLIKGSDYLAADACRI